MYTFWTFIWIIKFACLLKDLSTCNYLGDSLLFIKDIWLFTEKLFTICDTPQFKPKQFKQIKINKFKIIGQLLWKTAAFCCVGLVSNNSTIAHAGENLTAGHAIQVLLYNM